MGDFVRTVRKTGLERLERNQETKAPQLNFGKLKWEQKVPSIWCNTFNQQAL